RRLHRQFRRLLATQDAVDIAGRAVDRVDGVGAIGHQAAARRKLPDTVDRRQLVWLRQRDEALAVGSCEGLRCHDQPAVGFWASAAMATSMSGALRTKL